MNLTNGIRRSKEEKKQEVEIMLVEVGGLDGVDDLVGSMVTISGKKHNKPFWPF